MLHNDFEKTAVPVVSTGLATVTGQTPAGWFDDSFWNTVKGDYGTFFEFPYEGRSSLRITHQGPPGSTLQLAAKVRLQAGPCRHYLAALHLHRGVAPVYLTVKRKQIDQLKAIIAGQ